MESKYGSLVDHAPIEATIAIADELARANKLKQLVLILYLNGLESSIEDAEIKEKRDKLVEKISNV